jgi:glutamine amidotransferase
LGFFDGDVVRFRSDDLKVPHMGWNHILDARGPLFDGLPPQPAVYFVHSYFPRPADPELASGWCEYGGKFAACISRGALHATQFHPEKSQSTGLALLRNFLHTIP